MSCKVCVCEYDNLTDDRILQKLAGSLPLHFTEGWTEGKKWEKNRQRIVAWLLLAHSVNQAYGYSLTELDIRRDEFGKPYSCAHPEIHFNISHCDIACACIVGECVSGIDIERKFKYRENLGKKICHPEEWDRLIKMESEMREKQIQFLWSMKESFVKMDGRGLGYGMDQINFASILPIAIEASEADTWEYDGVTLLIENQQRYTLAACTVCRTEDWEICHFGEREIKQI